MTCPICVSVDNSSLIDGLRAGAVVLIVVGGLLIAAASRFAWRLRALDLAAEAVRSANRKAMLSGRVDGRPDAAKAARRHEP